MKDFVERNVLSFKFYTVSTMKKKTSNRIIWKDLCVYAWLLVPLAQKSVTWMLSLNLAIFSVYLPQRHKINIYINFAFTIYINLCIYY